MQRLLIAFIIILLVAGWNRTFKERWNALIGSSIPVSLALAQPHEASEYNDVLVIVEGKNGVGSGFLCNLGGHTLVITNAHVICGNPGFKLTGLNNKVLGVIAGDVAVGHDIVKLAIDATGKKSLEMMENLDANVKIGDEVMILGNISGGMVIKPVEGKVVGIGPNLVEVDAPFLPGNSGSPIIHKTSGKVLGVATYLLERKVGRGQNAVTVETRRFGYRLDSVKSWQPIDWPLFYAQAAQVQKIEALSDDYIQLFTGSQNGALGASYKTPAIQRAVQDYMRGDRTVRIYRLLEDLRFACRGDLTGFDSKNAYDYFRRKVEEQNRLRDAVYVELSRVIESKR